MIAQDDFRVISLPQLENQMHTVNFAEYLELGDNNAKHRLELPVLVSGMELCRKRIRPTEHNPLDKSRVRCRLDFNVENPIPLVFDPNVKHNLLVNGKFLHIKRIKHLGRFDGHITAVLQHRIDDASQNRLVFRCRQQRCDKQIGSRLNDQIVRFVLLFVRVH